MAHIKLIPVNHRGERVMLEQDFTYPVTDIVSVKLVHSGSIEQQDEIELRVRVVAP